MSRRDAKLAALLAGAVLLVGGCGSDDDEKGPGIPRGSADQLSRQLDLVQDRLDVTREKSAPGSCRDIESKSYPDIQRIIDALPKDTDEDVRGALEESIDRLKELTDSECSDLIDEIENRSEEETTPEPAAPEPTTTQEAPPPETQTETQPPETEPQQTTPDEKNDSKDGGIGPNGQGPPGQNGGGQQAPGQGNG